MEVTRQINILLGKFKGITKQIMILTKQMIRVAAEETVELKKEMQSIRKTGVHKTCSKQKSRRVGNCVGSMGRGSGQCEDGL